MRYANEINIDEFLCLRAFLFPNENIQLSLRIIKNYGLSKIFKLVHSYNNTSQNVINCSLHSWLKAQYFHKRKELKINPATDIHN